MKNKQTYLVITPFFPSNDSFVGSYIFDQVNEISKKTEFNIRIIKTVSLFSSEKNYEFNGFNVSIFKIIDFPLFILPGIFNIINRKRFLNFLSNEGIENVKYSHSHVSYPASYLVDDLVCKKIVQHHGLDVFQVLNGRSNLIKKLQKNYLIKRTIRQLNLSDLNVGVSELVLNELRKHSSYSPKDEFFLYNGVDTSKFYSLEVEKNNIFTIGCVANFWEIKDQITLIKAIEILSLKGDKVILRLIGSGPKLDECFNYVKEHNLDDIISFESEKAHSALNIFYNEIDLFVLPSYYEALGCVYLESWSTNTPFIAVKEQGISEIIPKKYKEIMLVSKSNIIELSSKISYFIENKVEIEFDLSYDIKNTISKFLKNKVFDD